MKKHIALLIALIPCLLAQAQHSVLVKVVIKGLEPGLQVRIQPYTIGGAEDSIRTKAGGFRATVVVPSGAEGPYLFWLVKKGRYTDDQKFLFLFLDSGDVHLEGEGPLFTGIRVSGARSATDYVDYNAYVSGNLSTNGTRDRDSMSTILTGQWILQHPASPISTYLLLWKTNGYRHLADKEVIFDQIAEGAKDNIAGRKLAALIASDKLTAVGRTALDFTQPDTLNRPVSLRDFRGKYVLVDFWASWCEPCREENPNVVAAYLKYKDRNFTVLSVSLERPGEKDIWMKAVHEDHLTWTNVSDLKYGYNEAAVTYGVSGIPFNVLIDPQGKIVARNIRGADLDKTLNDIL